MFNHCLILFKLGRISEGSKTWLHHRGFGTPMDSFQWDKITKKKRTELQ